MNYEMIVKNIESLPPLCDTTQIIQRLYANGSLNVNIIRLVIAIESDALLCANILKMINSPYYGFSSKINSVQQAVTLFGVEMMFALVVHYALSSTIVANLRAYGVGNDAFNEVCHLQSQLLGEWYKEINAASAAYLAPLAFIMEVGKLILAREITASGKIKSFLKGLGSEKSISIYEYECFGTSSYFVSGLLFDHWRLSAHYGEILKGLDFEHANITSLQEEIDVLDVVRTAVNVCDVLTEKSIDAAAEIVADMGHDAARFVAVAKKLQKMRKNEIR